jgi:hypothetical protein
MRIRPSAAVLAALSLAGGPMVASALADGPSTASTAALSTPSVSTSTTPTTTTTPTTPAPPPPKAATVRLYLSGAFFVHGKAVTVPGRRMSFEGVVRPYVAGQVVSIRDYIGHHLVKTDRLRVKPSPKGTYGAFTERVASPSAGIFRIEVRHPRTAQMLGFSRTRGVGVLTPAAGFGARGQFVDLMQQRLVALHIFDPQSGVYDAHMGLAVDAYHRLLGWGVSQALDGRTISALLDGWGKFVVHDPRAGTHAEGNLAKQLLALIHGGRVQWIFPISSGKPSTPTVLGHFRVYQRTPGYLPDGMYYSDFFYGGYAIHGYNPAPDYPASHGCMRLPIMDAIFVYNWLNYGDVVDVYY